MIRDGKEERKNRDVRKEGREKKGVMGEEEGNEEGRKGTGLWKYRGGREEKEMRKVRRGGKGSKGGEFVHTVYIG